MTTEHPVPVAAVQAPTDARNVDEGVLTLAKLDAMLKRVADIPPPPMLASSAMFPSDRAMRWSDDGRDYVAAGPGFWAKMPVERATGIGNPLFDIQIVDVDAAVNSRERAELFASLARALTPKKGA